MLSAPQFWAMMQRWSVPDATALELIGFSGKLGRSGKRPRFRLSTRQQRITGYLREIEATMAAAGVDARWLHRKAGGGPFGGQPPLAFMVRAGVDGIAEALRWLNRRAMRSALAGR